MILPNYQDGSIVNLMASIEKALGGKPKYNPLKGLSQNSLSESKNIVLFVFDGLGYEYIKKNGKGTILKQNTIKPITSVFPSTTATCVTTFATGLAPQQHALTGWFMNLKEVGSVVAILPFIIRSGKIFMCQGKLDPSVIINQKSMAEKINAKSYFATTKDIVDSPYASTAYRSFKRVGCGSLGDMFKKVGNILKRPGKKFIYVYWPKFDELCHHFGTGSKEAKQFFEEIDKRMQGFLSSAECTSTTVIITADHGLINTKDEKIIKLKDHPKLNECLTVPLCGEPRAAYCYVRPSKAKQFEDYVKTKLKYCCTLHKSDDLIRKGYFGLFEPNKKLFDRVGDYVLILKDNYIIKDLVLGEEERFHIGNHGGVSKEEMLVPLVVIKKGGCSILD